MLNWLQELHSAQGIAQLVGAGGLYVLFGIIFAETGLLFGFFLPGDSLLITAGVLSNPVNPNFIPGLNIYTMNVALIIAATLGNQTGYFLGNRMGERIWKRPDGRFYKRKHLEAAQTFYKTYGGFAVIAARYIPIFRTFVPFAAGMARMPYRQFVFWDITGGVLWITSLLWLGYFLGRTELANRLDKIIVIVIFVSVLPMIIGGGRKIFKQLKAV
ncbi:VTT domain-containing protein [bacterium]|jgi:membrane-associated protein|nr:VTT domain-containing protein [bacterium]